MSWWGLVSIFTSVIMPPLAGAIEPLALPLPQTLDYATYLRSQLLSADFSTDPQTASPRVAATSSALQAFIINYEPCVLQGDAIAYRLVVRNMGKEPINGVTAQFFYPESFTYKEATPQPAGGVRPQPGVVEWSIFSLLPGPENWHELNVTFVVNGAAGGSGTDLRVSGGGLLVGTGHSIPNNCPGAALDPGAPLPNKQPAIICDPGDLGCTPSLPNLGQQFSSVVNDPARQPTLCSPNDPDSCITNLPRLGARFAEATASLLPGECSVLEDAVLSEPDFQDGLLRQGEVAALFMRPLYDSGQEYSQLVLKNELLGIKNKLHAKNILRDIHTKHWQQRIEPLQNVLAGSTPTSTIRSQIEQWNLAWIQETREAQKDLQQRYSALQEERKEHFDPVAEQASTNAVASIDRACGGQLFPPRTPDAGLSQLLGGVKQQYTATLDQRTREYATTQATFANPDHAGIPAANQASTWRQNLRTALDAFDAGNKEPLTAFITNIPGYDRAGFNANWTTTYEVHAAADVREDEGVRLNRFEPALDVPKTVAAACVRDTTLAARVEVSWCESGLYPSDYIIREAPVPAKARDITPPNLIEGGENAGISLLRTAGESCGRRPGDPWWAADCSCSCNELIPSANQIKFCQVAREIPGRPGRLGETKPIIRHDIYAVARTGQTQEECWNELPFDDHFLVDTP